MTEATLKDRFAAGVSWTAVSQVTTQLVTFTTTVVLARILVPSDFGLVGMAAIYTGLIAMLSEIGLGAALIQRKEVDATQLDTVFWAGMLASISVLLVAYVCSPLAGRFFHDPRVTDVVRVSSLAFVATAAGAVHKVMLNRALAFDRIARVEIGAIVGYGLMAVSLAIAGVGAWAIVIGQLSRFVLEAMLLWSVEPYRPHARFDRSAFRDLFGFGANVWGFNFLNYARENVDFLVVGRVLGAAQLGFYTLGYNLANQPRRQLMLVIGRVTFPAFARIQDDDEALRRAYAKVIRFVSFASFPLLLGLALVSPQAVPLVYGTKWTATIVPLQILCGAGVLYSLGNSSGSIFMAKGRPNLLFKITLVSLAGLAAMLAVAVRWGIVGVASAVFGYTVISLSVGQTITNRLIGLTWRRFLSAVRPAAIACVPMAAVVLAVVSARPGGGALIGFAWLLGEVVLGAAVYLVALRAQRVPEVAEALSYASGRLRPLAGRVLGRARSGMGAREAGDVL